MEPKSAFHKIFKNNNNKKKTMKLSYLTKIYLSYSSGNLISRFCRKVFFKKNWISRISNRLSKKRRNRF